MLHQGSPKGEGGFGQSQGGVGDLSLEEKALLDHIDTLEVDVAPLEDDPENLLGVETQVELVSRYWVVVDDGLDNVQEIFENVVAQLKVLNPGVDLRTEQSSFTYTMEDEMVIVPEYLWDLGMMGESLATIIDNLVLEEMAQQNSGGKEQPEQNTRFLLDEHQSTT